MEAGRDCGYPVAMLKPYDTTLKQMLDDYAPDWLAWLAVCCIFPPVR